MAKIQVNGSIYCVHGLEELILLKCPYYPKRSIELNAIPVKIPMAYFTDLEQYSKNLYGTQNDPE